MLIHPSSHKDSNQLHEVSSHTGLKQRTHILFGDKITGEWVVPLLWQGELFFEIVIEECVTFLTAC